MQIFAYQPFGSHVPRCTECLKPALYSNLLGQCTCWDHRNPKEDTLDPYRVPIQNTAAVSVVNIRPNACVICGDNDKRSHKTTDVYGDAFCIQHINFCDVPMTVYPMHMRPRVLRMKPVVRAQPEATGEQSQTIAPLPYGQSQASRDQCRALAASIPPHMRPRVIRRMELAKAKKSHEARAQNERRARRHFAMPF